MKFDWKKLKYWHVGFSLWEVLIVKKIPSLPNLPNEPKKEDNAALCDCIDRKIYMIKETITTPDVFLETLSHELNHAKKYHQSVDSIMFLRNTLTTEEQIHAFDELTVDLEGFSAMEIMRNNIENFEYILSYFKSKRRKLNAWQEKRRQGTPEKK